LEDFVARNEGGEPCEGLFARATDPHQQGIATGGTNDARYLKLTENHHMGNDGKRLKLTST